MRKNSKRSLILTAALEVVEQKGARHLTIDAVAAQSGVSKGGVLYHFSSKDALLRGMLQHLVDVNQQRIEQRRIERPEENEVMAILESRAAMTPSERRASLAILAAAAENNELLDLVREHFDRVFNEVTAATSDQMSAIQLMLASEGLRFLDILGVNPLNRKMNAKVVSQMHQQAEEL